MFAEVPRGAEEAGFEVIGPFVGGRVDGDFFGGVGRQREFAREEFGGEDVGKMNFWRF
jgi:hypothetical protein